MLIYLLICLLCPYLVLENYVIRKKHSREQRMLPLLLGLACLYMFYLIVEYTTGAVAVFRILIRLLAMQIMLLVFFYILDLAKIKMPYWFSIVTFITLGVANTAICLRLYYGKDYALAYYVTMSFYGLIDLVLCIYVIAITRGKTKTRRRYLTVFLALACPVIGAFLAETGLSSRYTAVPAGVAAFSLILHIMLSTGEFYPVEDYIKDNLFHSAGEMLVLFDPDFFFLDASNNSRERFPEIIEQFERGPQGNEYREVLRAWSLHPHTMKVYEKDGYNYKVSLKPVSDSSGKNKGYIVNIEDITSEISEINNAKRLSRMKSDFLANMSHELRSPLNAIIGGSEIVLKKGAIPEASRVVLKHIQEAGKSLLEIVNSILDYSKIESGRLELRESEYDIKALLERQCYDACMQIKEKPVKFKLDAKKKIPRVLIGDEARVEMIIRNLISNACKYTNDGLIECTLDKESINETQVRIIFSVKDTGIGMTKEQIRDVFEKYVSYAENAIAESTGIGLYSVKQLTNMMGGDVFVESDGKSGSQFTVSFVQEMSGSDTFEPFTIDENVLRTHLDEEVEEVEPDYVYPNGRVLVVDDMKVNCEIFVGKTAPWQFSVDEAEDGYSAIEKVKHNHYDMIFMDQMMPGITGMEASAEIRKFTSSPIILLTANTSDEMRAEAESFGLEAFMPKPILMEDLKANIEKFMPFDLAERVIDTEQLDQTMIKQDENFRYVLEAYIEDIEDILPNLRTYFERDLNIFRVKVHGIKGTSRQIGKPGIGDLSEIMEMAAKAEHRPYIEKHLDSYIEDLKIVIEEAKEELAKIEVNSIYS